MRGLLGLAVAALGCGGALPPPEFGPDAPDASDVPCDYRAYADASVAVATPRANRADPALDPDLRLLDTLRATGARVRQLRELDRARVACRVLVPADRWSAALRRRIDASVARIEDILDARQRRVDLTDIDSLDGPLLDLETRHAAAHALAEVDEAVRVALEQRLDVLRAASQDACAVARVAELESWRDVARAATEDDAARREAERIASAIARAPADVDGVLGGATRLHASLDDFVERRARALALVTRCAGEVPEELLPRR